MGHALGHSARPARHGTPGARSSASVIDKPSQELVRSSAARLHEHKRSKAKTAGGRAPASRQAAASDAAGLPVAADARGRNDPAPLSAREGSASGLLVLGPGLEMGAVPEHDNDSQAGMIIPHSRASLGRSDSESDRRSSGGDSDGDFSDEFGRRGPGGSPGDGVGGIRDRMESGSGGAVGSPILTARGRRMASPHGPEQRGHMEGTPGVLSPARGAVRSSGLRSASAVGEERWGSMTAAGGRQRREVRGRRVSWAQRSVGDGRGDDIARRTAGVRFKGMEVQTLGADRSEPVGGDATRSGPGPRAEDGQGIDFGDLSPRMDLEARTSECEEEEENDSKQEKGGAEMLEVGLGGLPSVGDRSVSSAGGSGRRAEQMG